MNQIKKHSIGYNTVSSVDGIINARGVKSKPNNIQIFGYTHEIGEGEKSPDNPYKLISLDNGAMTDKGIDYEHSIKLTNNNTTIQVPVPIDLKSVDSVSDYIFKDKNGVWKLKQMCKTFSSTDNIDTLIRNGQVSTGTIVYRIGVRNDGLTGNRTAVKTNMFDIVLKDISKDNIAKFFIISDARITVYIRYDQRQYAQFSDVETLKAWLLENPFEIIYRAITQEEYILSDYAQDLLNSFTLQNNNKIWVEGYPDIKISGYIQK